MKSHIELEYKMIITKRQFMTFKKRYPFDYPLEQTNYYYDTSNQDLGAKRYSLRIRKVNQQLILTLKTPHPKGVMEYEQLVTSLDFKHIQLSEVITSVLSFINPQDLINFGFLITYRSVYELAYATLCLDENFYHNHHDYELEYEVKTDHDSYQAFLEILDEVGIHRHTPAMGKARRVKKAVKF